ncbi:unnamed protein product [Rhizophagus irregularis]|nr:unnamed protein product [Rhizophagus irregularis]
MNFTAIEDRRKSVLEKALAKTTKDTPSSSSSLQEVLKPSPSQGAPNASSSLGVPIPFLSSLESAVSSAEMTSDINKINSPEPRTPPHQNFSYDTSSGSSVCKEHGSKDNTSEDDLLMKSPVDITVDCKLIVKNMYVRSKMEQWCRSSRYVEEIHKQDSRIYFRLASINQDIEQDGRADDVKQYIKSILKNVNTVEKLRDIIRIECEKLWENGNTIWRKRVLDLMEILQLETIFQMAETASKKIRQKDIT